MQMALHYAYFLVDVFWGDVYIGRLGHTRILCTYKVTTMTRINVVPVECLTNKHLMAEYRELPRVFTAVDKLHKEGRAVTIPDTYRLGTGHIKFFYTKLSWLYDRYFLLMRELRKRGFNLDMELYHKISEDALDLARRLPSNYLGTYAPSPEDMYLNMARLVKRSDVGAALEELRCE
jgi:deoxyribonuclease (pyrimidine dimer)